MKTNKTYKRGLSRLLLITVIVGLLLIFTIPLVGCDDATDDVEESAWSLYLEENIDKLITLLTVISGVFGGVILSIYKIVKCIKEVKSGLSEVDTHKQSFDDATKVLDDNKKLYSDTLEQVSAMKTIIEDAVDKITSLKANLDESKQKEIKALYLALTNNGELVKKGVAREIGLLLEEDNEEK